MDPTSPSVIIAMIRGLTVSPDVFDLMAFSSKGRITFLRSMVPSCVGPRSGTSVIKSSICWASVRPLNLSTSSCTLFRNRNDIPSSSSLVAQKEIFWRVLFKAGTRPPSFMDPLLSINVYVRA